MGKLLKLACSRKWNAEHYNIENRLRGLFRKFAKLTNSNTSVPSSPIVISYPNLSSAPAANDRHELPSIPANIPVNETSPGNSIIVVEPDTEHQHDDTEDHLEPEEDHKPEEDHDPAASNPSQDERPGSPIDTAMEYDTMVKRLFLLCFPLRDVPLSRSCYS